MKQLEVSVRYNAVVNENEFSANYKQTQHQAFIMEMIPDIKGSPLGRSYSGAKEAVDDLRSRIREESGVDIVVVNQGTK